MAAAAASVVQCLARPPGQQRAPSGMGQRRVQARALSFPAQPSPLSTFTTSPAQRLEGPSCPWPATSPAAEGPASSSPVQGVWAALMTGHTVEAGAQRSESLLPPEVERIARFSDGPGSAAAGEPQSHSWLASWWRYQGL